MHTYEVPFELVQAPFDPTLTAGGTDALPQLFLFMAVFSTTGFRSRRDAVREAWMVRHLAPRPRAYAWDLAVATLCTGEGMRLESLMISVVDRGPDFYCSRSCRNANIQED